MLMIKLTKIVVRKVCSQYQSLTISRTPYTPSSHQVLVIYKVIEDKVVYLKF